MTTERFFSFSDPYCALWFSSQSKGMWQPRCTDSHCTVAITIIHRQLLLGQRLVGNVLSPSYFTGKEQQKVVKVYINGFSNNILDYIYCRIFFLHVSVINLTRKSKFMPTVCIIINSTHLMWKTYSLIAWFRFWLVKCVLKHYYFNYVNL